jgi:ABC-type transport system involved in multi-copper enzyme maturation permease subunit
MTIPTGPPAFSVVVDGSDASKRDVTVFYSTPYGVKTGSFVDATLTAAAVSSFLVEVAAFVGLMFLYSHLVKSSGLLIGIGVVLFIVLDLFWQVIIFALTSLMGGTPSSAVYLQANIVADFFNPMQFVTLVYTYLTDQFTSNPIQPSTYGITATTLVAAAVIWISFPFSIVHLQGC